MKKILLRADDLGYSEAVNYGIEKTVKEGLIRSVGVMVNMPATKHGVHLLKDEPIAFGQHTNFCAGQPISNPKLIPSLVDKDGMFKTSSVYRKAEEDFVHYDEALIEIEAQYHRFLALFNKKPDYFEGHAVASANFFRALEDFAQENGLKYSGIPEGKEPNDLDEGSYVFINQSKVYMTMESMNKSYEPYNTFYKMVNGSREDGVEMMIFHPGYLDDYIIQHSSLLFPRTKEVTFLTDPEISNFLIDKEIDCLDYRDL